MKRFRSRSPPRHVRAGRGAGCVSAVGLLYQARMNSDVLLGCLIVAAALGLCAGLVVWARRSIDRIARRGYRTAREILRERDGGG